MKLIKNEWSSIIQATDGIVTLSYNGPEDARPVIYYEIDNDSDKVGKIRISDFTTQFLIDGTLDIRFKTSHDDVTVIY